MVDKVRIVAEGFSGERPVSEVALKHGIHRNQIYNWRRELAEAAGAEVADGSPFVRVRLAQPEPEASTAELDGPVDKTFAVEVAFSGATVRVRDGADSDLVRTVLTALSASR